MNVLTVFLQANAGGGSMSMSIMMVAIFAIMYFFMIRPQQKKQKVITAGGIYGKIKELDVTTVTLEIASGVKIKIDRNSIYANAQQNGANN